MELLGVIGNPIGHSLSPVMHSAAFKAVGRSALYLPFLVEADQLSQAIYGAQALGFTGLNITVPYKEKVLPYLTELTDEAEAVQSVNTIKFTEDRIIGHSTDGEGFMAAAEYELGYDFRGKTVLIMGAGGAAKAVTAALLNKQCQVYITNRTLERAEQLVHSLNRFGTQLEVVPLNSAALEPVMDEIEVVVNTTSVGMAQNLGQTPLAPSLLAPHQLVIDIIYNPEKTQLLKAAEQIGCRVQNGVGMLVWQAVKAWEFWWGITPPAEIMYQAVKASLS